MNNNTTLILEIMTQAIKINNTQKQNIHFEFYPLTKVLSIDIYFNGKSGKGLTKTWSVDTTQDEYLKEVKKDLDLIDETIEDDFLG